MATTKAYYNLSITADSEQKCLEKMKAVSTLIKSLDHEDLLLLAKTASETPDFVKKAKPYLPMLL